MTSCGRLARLAAATLLAAAAGVLPALAPVVAPALAADGCRPGHGVTVVVDFHRLPHDDVRACVPGGGGSDAAAVLADAGLALTDVQRQPGFVCRVDGLPADDPCVNTPPSDAYWSLWWSDGSSGEWTYSTVMASALEVPDGGFVGLVWQRGAAELRPAVPPVAGRGSGPTPAPTQAARAGQAGQAGQAGHTRAPGGLPVWVTPVAVGVLLVGAAGTAAARRRRAGGGS
ncbi:hypothetical protein [Nocardioides panaciterrulae]|uniref:Uncharacterized protein n=1 Tax=Nocardioides panaciterrulae TaxID=661492 RepID=A0A7Y9E799_9ACTN|nr:hypothetical protein [Nocardioides panaciterrulae]NYD42529.1 hypothetical protein [Nocardioides panaciterrulae]